MKNIFLLSILIFSFIHYPIFGQITDFTNTNDIIPPSPEAAGLGKYGDIPLSLYTGQSAVNLPIYTVNVDGMTLPISLSYQGDAIKVRDRASRIGLGWSLNAGGVITRAMRGGMPDDFRNSEPFFGGVGCINGLLYGGDSDFENMQYPDSEHDMFYYNFLGNTGKFIIGEDGVLFLPHANLKIEFDWEENYTQIGCPFSEIYNIYITTPDGIKYSFTAKEETEFNPSSSPYHTYYSSWYLTQINHPNGQSIDLSYINVGSYESEEYSKKEFVGLPSSECHCDIEGTLTVPADATRTTITTHTLMRLDRITYTNGEIIFNGVSREDFIPDETISTISVYNEGTLVKEYQLNQSYFISPGGTSEEYKRLRLDEIVEVGGSESITLYSFNYNEEIALPHRLSNEIDIWGFYNDNDVPGSYTSSGVSNLFPTIYVYPNDLQGDRFSVYPRNNYNGGEIILEGADRQSNEIAIQAGILTKVTYPTGGSTEFEYEMHEFDYKGNTIQGGGLRVKSVTNDALNGPGLTKEYKYLKEDDSTSGAVTGIPQHAYLCSLPDESLLDEWLNVTFNYQVEEISQGVYETHLMYHIIGYSIDDIESVTFNGSTFNSAIGTITYTSQSPPPSSIAISFEATLTAGCSVSTSFTILQNETITKNIYNQGAGSCAALSAFHVVKLISDQNKLGSHSGSFIGYSRVEEIIADNGKVVHEYSNPETNPDLPPTFITFGPGETCESEFLGFYNEYDVFPFPRGTSKDYERGLLQHKRIYEEGNDQTPIQTENHYYQIIDVDVVEEAMMVKFDAEDYPYDFEQGGTWELESKIVLPDYKETILDNVTTTKDFGYSIFTYIDGYIKYNKSSESITNSDGEVFTTSFLYSNDLNDQLTLNNHMLGIPLEIHTPGSSGQKMEFIAINGRILPYKYYTKGFQPNLCGAAINGAWKLEGTVEQYNGINPSTISKPCESNSIVINWVNNRIVNQQYISQLSTFTYNPKGGVESINDPNGQYSFFQYDEFERLDVLQSRNGAIIDLFTYNLGLSNGGSNYVEKITTTDVNVPPSKTLVDGLGRQYGNVFTGYTYNGNDLGINTSQDALGRIILEDDPRKGAAWISEYEKSVVGRKIMEQAAGWPASISYFYANENYNGGQYFKTIITNENGNITDKLVDKIGRTKLERKYLSGSSVETIYEYDQRGNVTMITQPNGDVFSYTYFDDGKLESENIPGKGTITYEYNDRDLLWKITDNGVVENIYDDYSRLDLVKLDGDVISELDYYSFNAGAGSKGQLSTRTDKVLGTAQTVTRSYSYDSFGRIGTTTYHHLLGTDVFTNTYNHRDQVEFLTRTTHEGQTISYDYIYDHGGRLIEIIMTVDGITEKISITKYNERDWITTDRLGVDIATNIELQKIGYGYNIRGWLTKINDLGECTSPLPEPIPANEVELTHDEGTVKVLYDADALAAGTPSSIAIVSDMKMYSGTELMYFVNDTTILPKGSYGYEDPYKNEDDYQLLGAFDLSATGELIASTIITNVRGINPDLGSTSLISEEYFRKEIKDRMEFIPRHYDCSGDALFAEEINYLSAITGVNAVAQYNGNISSVRWRALNRDYIPAFGFAYDKLDRLEQAKYGEKNASSGAWQNFDRYSTASTYDEVGNIETLTRLGLININGTQGNYGIIDDLTLTHSGGRLQSVSEIGDITKGFKTGGGYGYDGFGNVQSTPNVSSITYNYLNLPESVTLANGGSQINYYDAAGVKVKKEVVPPATGQPGQEPYTLHYIDGIEYKNQIIESIQHEKGRILYEEGQPYHEYVISDHTGSGRVYFSDKNGDGQISTDIVDEEVTQEQHYYPFGMSIEGIDFIAPLNPVNAKKYTGMEHQMDGDFGWYDYGARYYDPTIGRFMQVDPLADATPHYNSYVYTLNNPIRFIDPSGLLASEISDFGGGGGVEEKHWWHDEDGELLYDSDGNIIGKRFKSGSTDSSSGYDAQDDFWTRGGYLNEEECCPWLDRKFDQQMVNKHAVENGQNPNEAWSQFNDATGSTAMGEAAADAVVIVATSYMSGAVVNLVLKGGRLMWVAAGASNAAKGSKWVYGGFKSSTKWANQLSKRGWTEKQIGEAIVKGKQFNAVNNVNKANAATRYVHPTTGQSVVIDNVTKELLHVGGKGFKY